MPCRVGFPEWKRVESLAIPGHKFSEDKTIRHLRTCADPVERWNDPILTSQEYGFRPPTDP